MGPILVFGHRNPDNDSICSAVAYAHLKNLTDTENVYVPARLGPVPQETAWVFDRFGVSLPEQIAHVHTRVRDVMTESVITIAPELPMLEAGRLMREHDVRALPVVDARGALVGLVSQRMLAERYLDETEIAGFTRMSVAVGLLAQVLEGELVAGDPGSLLSGNVLIGASEPETVRAALSPGDVLIVGDRLRTQPMALEAGVCCLIITAGARPTPGVLEMARAKGTTIIVTPKDSYSAARLVSLANAVGDLMETDVLTVAPEMLLAEAAEDLLGSVHREAVVTDNDGTVAGILTRTNVARGIRRRVVLVDHNESAQSALGIEDAEVIEIVDHHRVGDIETAGPILFLNLPVGSTATIVALRYEELGFEVPAPIAGILLAALLTDTVILKSPTTTETDRRICAKLAEQIGVDSLQFGMEIFRSRSAGVAFSAEKVVRADVKEYRAGDVLVAIAQYETVDLSDLMQHSEEVRSAMEALRASRDYDLVVLMATDIVREGSELLAIGKVRLAERAFGVDLSDGSAWMPGLLSRKKQVAAPLVQAAGS
ncbi:MAG TPA: putative manganese-dependent inorganic diphosphatase [Coriobacteriia bacterium]|nr:putative manganese-dependent inorganic diphosphatase [Coriobacteriia bacterium]